MKQHIHIVGICGTFMGSLAQLAVQAGYRVTGCDAAVYPPMSTQLELAGIELIDGFSSEQLELNPDLWVIGNVVSRGNELMEAILNRGLAYISGPQWLADTVLQGRWVLAVAGTHGKTTTTAMLAWILEYAGFKPGFLIGGVAQNFAQSARLGASDFFVIEADEYDTAFFDKRSKFVHYKPQTLILNNLEFDHADIFDDLAAIQKQFHHLVRTVSSIGMIISPGTSSALNEVLAMGCWSERQHSDVQLEPELSAKPSSGSKSWACELIDKRNNTALIKLDAEPVGELHWALTGTHNLQNAVHAIAAARHIGIEPSLACEALAQFQSVARRMQLIAQRAKVSLYDDFAHHPTAIELTLEGLRNRVGGARILAVIEPRSNTMKLGIHADRLAASAMQAESVFWFDDGSMSWDLGAKVCRNDDSAQVFDSYHALYEAILLELDSAADTELHIVLMSNGGFGGLPAKLKQAMQ